MSKIYKNQENLRIQLTTGVNIANAEATQIKYEKPDGTEGFWNAEVGNTDTGIIYYDVKKTENGADIDQSGTWQFWAFITFSDSRSAQGESAYCHIWEKK